MRWHEDGEARSGFFKQRADADVLKSQLDGEAVASKVLAGRQLVADEVSVMLPSGSAVNRSRMRSSVIAPSSQPNSLPLTPA